MCQRVFIWDMKIEKKIEIKKKSLYMFLIYKAYEKYSCEYIQMIRNLCNEVPKIPEIHTIWMYNVNLRISVREYIRENIKRKY